MKLEVVFALISLIPIVRADNFDTWFAASPDKKFVAVERRIPDSDEPSRLDLDGFTVFICTAEDGIQRSVIAQHTFPERLVSQIRWSPDSQFLLFTTASAGGHSPWHFKTYAFYVADKSFRDVESAAGGSVGAADFRFEPPDIAVLKLHDPASDTPRPIKLALGKAMQRMQRLE
jgi:dipeptidyl aminopeptidase/acylaminoacyl peptidase